MSKPLLKTQTTVEALNNEDTLHTPNVLSYFSASSDSSPKTTPNDLNLTESDKNAPLDRLTVPSDVTLKLIMPTSKNTEAKTDEVLVETSRSDVVENIESSPSKQPIVLDINSSSPHILKATTVQNVIVIPHSMAVIQAQTSTAHEMAQIVQRIDAELAPNAPNKRIRPLKQLLPKKEIRIATQPIVHSNLIKERLKEALLKTRRNLGTQAESSNCEPPSKYSAQVPKVKTKVKKPPEKQDDSDSSKVQLFERNRVAAQRYRNKLKMRQNEVKERNRQLERENDRLRKELQAIKMILLSHQNCSVTKALASATSNAIGTLPSQLVPISGSAVQAQVEGDKVSDPKRPLYYIVQKIDSANFRNE